MLYFLFGVYIILSAGGLVLFKLGSKDLIFNIINGQFNLSFNWYLLSGMVSYMFSFLLWLYIVSQTKISLALPISVGLVNILVLLGAIFILGENVSFLQWIGVIVILVGLLILNMDLFL